MINVLFLKYIVNWLFISALVFLIIYCLFYTLIIKRNKINTKKKFVNISYMIICIIFSVFVCGFSEYRTYRHYKIEERNVSIYSFLKRAIQDYKEDKIIEIFSSNVRVEKHSVNPGTAHRPNDASKRKTTYLNIDDGKYIIPIDTDKINFFNINDSQEYIIYMYKNTKLIDHISMRERKIG